LIWFNRGRSPQECDGDAVVVPSIYIIRTLDGVLYRAKATGKVLCFSTRAAADSFLDGIPNRVTYRILEYRLKDLMLVGLKAEELTCLR